MVLHPHLDALHRDPPIIGLTGYARSGKDTVAARLVERFAFHRFAFADKLRAAALELDPIVDWTPAIGDPLYDPPEPARLSEIVGHVGWEVAKDFYPEVRRILQHYGMSIRAIDEDFWVRPVMADIASTRVPAVITDVRFRNEVDAIRRKGGFLVRVVRPGVGPVNGHVSETELARVVTDFQIVNDGDLQALYRQVDGMRMKVEYFL